MLLMLQVGVFCNFLWEMRKMGKRKKVAVFVSNIYGMMIKDMQAGISETALEKGIKLIYFASFSDGFSHKIYDQYEKYDEGDIVPFKILDLKDFDGAILLTSSFPVEYKERIDRILLSSGIPVVNLGGQDERYISIINDERKSFGDVIEHLIKEHGCKDIYHIAGEKKQVFTHTRVNTYKEVLNKYGLPCSDEKIYYGTLWRDCGDPGLDYILECCRKEGKEYPDAIVCANDYTAIGVVDACRKRHIRVPEDIIVTGYDGVEAALLGYPSITTSAQPFYEVGRESILTLEKLWNGENLGTIIYSNGNIRKNQSCGCVPMNMNNIEEIRQIYSGQMGKMEYLAQSMTNMIISLSNASTIEECFKEIENNARRDTGFKDFLLCLTPEWDSHRVINDNTVIKNEKMLVVAGFRGEKSVPWQTFNLKDILPQDMLDDPNPYYIFSIHHLQYFMGYMIVSPTLEGFNQLIMKSWLVNLGSMLENWRIRRELKVTVDRLENLYNRDMLTGLYNRRGYEHYFAETFMECARGEKDIAVLVIDMDDLKIINDNFGHDEGDYSLCTIAEAMKAASDRGEICLRTGGDEFVVLAGDYSKENVTKYVGRLREYIFNKIMHDKKPFKLEVSVGAYVGKPDAGEGRTVTEISEEFMKFADIEMYKEKKEHKKRDR